MRPSARSRATPSRPPTRPWVPPELKAEVRGVAEDAAAKVFSYSHTTLTADKAAARELLTGEMLEQYDDTMAGVVGTSLANKTVVSATVLGSALISVKGDDAKVLVFVNQRTKGPTWTRPCSTSIGWW